MKSHPVNNPSNLRRSTRLARQANVDPRTTVVPPPEPVPTYSHASKKNRLGGQAQSAQSVGVSRLDKTVLPRPNVVVVSDSASDGDDEVQIIEPPKPPKKHSKDIKSAQDVKDVKSTKEINHSKTGISSRTRSLNHSAFLPPENKLGSNPIKPSIEMIHNPFLRDQKSYEDLRTKVQKDMNKWKQEMDSAAAVDEPWKPIPELKSETEKYKLFGKKETGAGGECMFHSIGYGLDSLTGGRKPPDFYRQKLKNQVTVPYSSHFKPEFLAWYPEESNEDDSDDSDDDAVKIETQKHLIHRGANYIMESDYWGDEISIQFLLRDPELQQLKVHIIAMKPILKTQSRKKYDWLITHYNGDRKQFDPRTEQFMILLNENENHWKIVGVKIDPEKIRTRDNMQSLFLFPQLPLWIQNKIV